MTAALAIDRLIFLAHHCNYEWASNFDEARVRFYAARPEICGLRIANNGLYADAHLALWNVIVATSNPASRPQPSKKIAEMPTTEAECWARFLLSALPYFSSGGAASFPFIRGAPSWSYVPVSEVDHNVCAVSWEIDPGTGTAQLYHHKESDEVRGLLLAVVYPDGVLGVHKNGEYDLEQLLEMEDALSALGARLPLSVWLGVSCEELPVYVSETQALQERLMEETHPLDRCHFNKSTIQATVDRLEDTWHRRVLLKDSTIVGKWPETRVRELRQEAVYKICARKGIAGFNPYRACEDPYDC